MLNPDFKLTIETGNSAFDPDPSKEIVRILRELATEIENKTVCVGAHIRLLDVNGNTVGAATFAEDGKPVSGYTPGWGRI